MSARKQVVWTTRERPEPAASKTAFRFSITRSVWTRISPSTREPSGARGIWPETKTKPPAFTACA